MEGPSIDGQLASVNEVLALYKVLSVCLSRLVKGELTREFLPVEVHGEDVLGTVVGVVDLGDVDGVISKIVVEDILLLTEAVEPQDLPIVLQELFLGRNSWIRSDHAKSQGVIKDVL